ncbi:hypothetical protein CEXT_267221 [Caerostris extrusa]|uniref:Uncharacterized protein n=1 Tax=Caerostris extrusa TaxID=172846 RepID=A0AAV4QFY4_CAEEX|nr:hypothetical protein CEXT_267221 [Caerostris extrusa]
MADSETTIVEYRQSTPVLIHAAPQAPGTGKLSLNISVPRSGECPYETETLLIRPESIVSRRTIRAPKSIDFLSNVRTSSLALLGNSQDDRRHLKVRRVPQAPRTDW